MTNSLYTVILAGLKVVSPGDLLNRFPVLLFIFLVRDSLSGQRAQCIDCYQMQNMTVCECANKVRNVCGMIAVFTVLFCTARDNKWE